MSAKCSCVPGNVVANLHVWSQERRSCGERGRTDCYMSGTRSSALHPLFQPILTTSFWEKHKYELHFTDVKAEVQRGSWVVQDDFYMPVLYCWAPQPLLGSSGPCHVLSGSIVSNSLRPLDCSPSGSSVHGIFQARILEWIATSCSKGSSRPGRFFTTSATWEVLAGAGQIASVCSVTRSFLTPVRPHGL